MKLGQHRLAKGSENLMNMFFLERQKNGSESASKPLFYFYIEIQSFPNFLGKEMKPPKEATHNHSPEVN